jgi:hypothetical protein
MADWTQRLRETARVDVLAAAAIRRERQRGVRLVGYAALCFAGAAASWAARYWLSEDADGRIVGWGPLLTIVGAVLIGFGLAAFGKANAIGQPPERMGQKPDPPS